MCICTVLYLSLPVLYLYYSKVVVYLFIPVQSLLYRGTVQGATTSPVHTFW